MFAFLDCNSTTIFCLYMLYVNRDGITFMKIANYIGMAAYVIHILIGTESPRWLLLNKRYEEAFKSLNWIT